MKSAAGQESHCLHMICLAMTAVQIDLSCVGVPLNTKQTNKKRYAYKECPPAVTRRILSSILEFTTWGVHSAAAVYPCPLSIAFVLEFPYIIITFFIRKQFNSFFGHKNCNAWKSKKVKREWRYGFGYIGLFVCGRIAVGFVVRVHFCWIIRPNTDPWDIYPTV